MSKNKLVISTVFLATLCVASLAIAQCSLQTLTPQVNKIDIGTTVISLGETSDPVQPVEWLGPLQAGRCTFDIGIIEQPIALTQNGQLYVATFSGSERQIGLYDLKTCTVRWKSDVFEGGLELTSDALRMDDQRMPLDDQCVPIERKMVHVPLSDAEVHSD
jgi:hypothetical protein